jgi:CBS domain-containing protein
MTRVHQIMTQSLASCSPDTSVKEAAATMRDRNIGDVLVMEDGKLRGIVTDRDLATRALTGEDDPRQTPIRNYLTGHVVTGHPDWDLDQVAGVMAKHQIRRLPIVRDNQVVGIVSLGDIAMRGRKKQSTAEALAEISEPVKLRSTKVLRTGGRVLALLAAATAVTVWMSLTKSGQRIRKQVEKSGLPEAALGLKDSVQEKLTSPESRQQAAELVEQSRQQAAELVEQLRQQLGELSVRLPNGRIKPKRKRFWLV